jgi:hypothetical protein
MKIHSLSWGSSGVLTCAVCAKVIPVPRLDPTMTPDYEVTFRLLQLEHNVEILVEALNNHTRR